MRRPKKRRLAVGRILQAGLALTVLVFGLILAASSFGWPALSGGPASISYGQFEKDLKDRKVRQATVDRNVIAATYADNSRARVLSPSPDRTVELMLKFEVQVEAARPLPSSGINLPVLGAMLLPYALVAYFLIGLVKAADQGIDINVADWEPSGVPVTAPDPAED